jgi:hypothetical protein
MANKQAIVTFEKEFLTGLYAGKRVRGHLLFPSRKSAVAAKKDLVASPVDSGEFSGDMFKYVNLRVVKITQALNL